MPLDILYLNGTNVTDLSPLAGMTLTSLRLHDTHEGRLLSTAVASGHTVDELDDALQKAADELLHPVR